MYRPQMHHVGKCNNRFPSEHAGARTYTLLPTLTVSTSSASPVHHPPDAQTILFIKISQRQRCATPELSQKLSDNDPGSIAAP